MIVIWSSRVVFPGRAILIDLGLQAAAAFGDELDAAGGIVNMSAPAP